MIGQVATCPYEGIVLKAGVILAQVRKRHIFPLKIRDKKRLAVRTCHFADFMEEANFKYAKFQEGVNFRKAVFDGTANFKYMKISDSFNIRGANFRGGDDFKYAMLNNRSVSLTSLQSASK